MIYSLFFIRRKNLISLKTPKVITFFVTNRCNARCSHCFYWKNLNKLKKEELNLEQIKKTAKSLKHPLTTLLLTGGEPFLREDIFEICKIFEKYNKTSKVVIPTNGFFSEEIYKTVKKIVEETNLFVDVNISIDGMEETSSKIRGIKNIFLRYEDTIRLLKRIKNKRFQPTILTTISTDNYSEILNLLDYNNRHWSLPHRFQYLRSCNEVYNIDPKIVQGFFQRNKKTSIPPLDKMGELNKRLDGRLKDNDLQIRINKMERKLSYQILNTRKRIMECVAGNYDAVIFPNGDVSLCEMTKPFANLKEFNYDFYKLWSSKKANKMREKIRSCSCIHSCNLINSMTHDKDKLLDIFKIHDEL
ncbi:MAG: radical SAM protein [Candidatus Pacearchaeota archaeon]